MGRHISFFLHICAITTRLQPPDGDGGQPPDDPDDPAGLVTYLPIPFSIPPFGRPLELPGQRTRQGVTQRCRLSLLTNSALVYESQCGGMGWGGEGGGGCGVSANEYSIAVHIT
jgi:hypothetical protein